MNQRFVITAMATVSGIGNDLVETWNNILAGNSQVSRIETFATDSFTSNKAFLVRGLNFTDYIPKQLVRRYDRYTKLGLVAGIQCLDMAKLDDTMCTETGLVVSTALGPVETNRQFIEEIERIGSRTASPALFPNTVINAMPGYLATIKSIHNYSNVLVGLSALENGLRALRLGRCERIMCGCVEEISIVTYEVASQLGLIASEAGGGEFSRPFSVNSNGFILGEGSTMILLETLDSARQREATVIAEVISIATLNDHAINPKTHFRAISKDILHEVDAIALERAQLEVGDIDVIVAAASSAFEEDSVEGQEIYERWGGKIPVVLPKAYAGEMMGADTEFAVLLASKILQEQIIPPVSYDDTLTAPLQIVRSNPLSGMYHHVLIHAWQHGGNTTSMILRRYGE